MSVRELSDDLLIEHLLVALRLELNARPLTTEVIRRGLVERAEAVALERTRDERRRLGSK